MTLGPALVLLSRLPDTVSGFWQRIVMFGRVPLFFYLIHLPLIHGFAVLYALAVYGRADWLMGVQTPRPGDYGFNLGVVYAIWGAILVLLYPVCAWFTRKKRDSTAAWLRYF